MCWPADGRWKDLEIGMNIIPCRCCFLLQWFNGAWLESKGPHTPPRLKPTANCLYPTTPLGGARLVPVIQNMKTGNDGTVCIEKQNAHHKVQRHTRNSAPPTHRADSLAHCQSQWPYSWHTTRVSNGSDGWQPAFSDFASWIRADAVHTVPKPSNTAEHTKQICYWTCPTLPERFRWPTVGPVCFRFKHHQVLITMI